MHVTGDVVLCVEVKRQCLQRYDDMVFVNTYFL